MPGLIDSVQAGTTPTFSQSTRRWLLGGDNTSSASRTVHPRHKQTNNSRPRVHWTRFVGDHTWNTSDYESAIDANPLLCFVIMPPIYCSFDNKNSLGRFPPGRAAAALLFLTHDRSTQAMSELPFLDTGLVRDTQAPYHSIWTSVCVGSANQRYELL